MPVAHARIGKRAVPIPREMPQANVAALRPADNAAAKSNSPPDKASAAASSSTRTIQEQVAAEIALAERVTAVIILSPEPQWSNSDRFDRSEIVPRSDDENTTSASPNNTDNLVVLLMARREIKSISDLANKDIAIEDKQSGSSGSVRIAIAVAGAAAVRLSQGQAKAVDRLISGEVPAAVLTLVSPEVAEMFPKSQASTFSASRSRRVTEGTSLREGALTILASGRCELEGRPPRTSVAAVLVR